MMRRATANVELDAVSANGWCNANGCWSTDPPYIADNNSTTIFGYGKTTFGTVKVKCDHSLNGAQMQTYVSVMSSTPLQALEAEGELLRGSPTSSGTPVDGEEQFTDKASLAANTWWHPTWEMGSTHYNAADKQFVNHANSMLISWNEGDYPGFWWVAQKSSIASDGDNNNVYRFGDSEKTFSNPLQSGWQA
jgi:hypothetical protein